MDTKRRTVLKAAGPIIATIGCGRAMAQASSCQEPLSTTSQAIGIPAKGTPVYEPSLDAPADFRIGIAAKGTPYQDLGFDSPLYIGQDGESVEPAAPDGFTPSCYASFTGV